MTTPRQGRHGGLVVVTRKRWTSTEYVWRTAVGLLLNRHVQINWHIFYCSVWQISLPLRASQGPPQIAYLVENSGKCIKTETKSENFS